MLNNFQDLFLKYRKQIEEKKNIYESVIFYIKENLKIDLKKENIILNQEKKIIKIKNLESSKNFILKINLEKINQILEKELKLKIEI